MIHRTLVLGGARSGKSGHAEAMLPADRPVTYVATARRVPDDREWEERIAAHVARRPAAWRTVEAATPEVLPATLAAARPDDPPVLVDDVVNWLAGVLDAVSAWDGGAVELARAREHTDRLVVAVRECAARLILVTNEVGLGIVPATRSGRLFRDELGVLNTRLAGICDEALLLVAGIPLQLKAPKEGP